MLDRRLDLILRRCDAEKLDKIADHFLGIRHQLSELDPEHGHVGMLGDEVVSVIAETALQNFALLVVCCEPLATMFLAPATVLSRFASDLRLTIHDLSI